MRKSEERNLNAKCGNFQTTPSSSTIYLRRFSFSLCREPCAVSLLPSTLHLLPNTLYLIISIIQFPATRSNFLRYALCAPSGAYALRAGGCPMPIITCHSFSAPHLLTFPSSWLVPHPATRTPHPATRIPLNLFFQSAIRNPKSAIERPASHIKYFCQILPRIGFVDFCDLFRGSAADDIAPLITAFRTQIDDMVGGLDDIHVVLDDDN